MKMQHLLLSWWAMASFLIATPIAQAQNTDFGISRHATPKTEVRGVWLTTLFGLDWPKNAASTEAGKQRQQAELRAMLDNLQTAGINTVFFQARIRGDVAYRSQIEPINAVFSSRIGVDPGYDPLAYVIEECHKRGMECHAWLVAFPLGSQAQQQRMGRYAQSRNRDLPVLQHNGAYYLDPGNPATDDYLSRIVNEIVHNYNIDGIQFDYFRYPENGTNFPDAATYRQYGQGMSKADWRRENLNRILRRLYAETKARKPYLKVSTCPLGKYADLPRYSAGGFNARDAVYQDAKQWLREGLQDWIVPMLYYRDHYFYPFVLDWLSASFGRPVAAGLGIYFLDPSEGRWSLRDVEDQLKFCQTNGVGIAFYRAQFFVQNIRGLRDSYVRHYAPHLALLPPMTWMNSPVPAPPSNLNVAYSGLRTHLTWNAPLTQTTFSTIPIAIPQVSPIATPMPVPTHSSSAAKELYYNIYASDTWPVDTHNPANLIAVRHTTQSYTYNSPLHSPFRRYFAITSYDRYNQESEPRQMPEPHPYGLQALYK